MPVEMSFSWKPVAVKQGENDKGNPYLNENTQF
jgi:hypothetical protein